jgi:hypothetical protein
LASWDDRFKFEELLPLSSLEGPGINVGHYHWNHLNAHCRTLCRSAHCSTRWLMLNGMVECHCSHLSVSDP